MIFWVIAAVLTAVVLALVARPFFVLQSARTATADYDVEVYKDQIRQLERERDEGLITTREYDGARAEVARRLLAADKQRQQVRTERTFGAAGRFVAVSLIVAVPAGALAIYFTLGSPGSPDMPFAARTQEVQQAEAARDPGNLGPMADRLAQRLENEPGDIEGWLLLGRTYMAMQRYGEAVGAFVRARTLAPDDPGILGVLGEAQVFGSQGVVTDAAQETFRQLLAIDRGNPRAHYYLSEALYQSGRRRDALEGWLALGRTADPTTPWLPTVKARVEQVAAELGVDVAGQLPEPAPEGTPPPLQMPGASQPSAADMAAIAALPEDERNEAIHGMVEGLAARLEASPLDLEGWQRLIRARSVLGETGRAEADLGRALEVFRNAPVPRRNLLALADDLGLAAPEGAIGGASGGAAAADAPRGPTREEMAAAQDMSPEDRQAMIEGMVEGLATRLEENPDNLEGWFRLAQSYNALGRPEAALDSLRKAEVAFPDNPSILLLQGRVLRGLAQARTTPESAALMDRVLALDPDNVEALWFSGIAALDAEDRDRARRLFEEAIAALPAGSAERGQLEAERDRLLGGG